MKNLLRIVVRSIGWKRALATVWDLCDDDLKEYVAKSDPQWDDEAVRILDGMIKDLTKA